MNTPARFAVIGNPIAHSLSPDVHAAFARDCGVDLEYEKLFAPEDGFDAAASRFFETGGRGMNVTAPFKGDAAAWVDELDGGADRVGQYHRRTHGQQNARLQHRWPGAGG